MKQRVYWAIVPMMAIGLGACQSKKKEETQGTQTPAQPAVTEAAKPTPSTPPAPAAEVKTPALSPAERAAKLGFVKYMPADTEVVLAFHNGKKTTDRIKSSKLWKLIEAESGSSIHVDGAENNGMELENEDFELPEGEQAAPAVLEPATQIPAPAANAPEGEEMPPGANPEETLNPEKLFGKEFTIALGKPVGEQTANLLTLNRRVNALRMRNIVRAIAAAAKEKDTDALSDVISESFNEEFLKDLLNDPASGTALYEKMAMPPLYLAYRITPETVAATHQQISSGLGMMAMMGEMVEPAEIEQNGIKFAGFKINGEKVSASMAEERESMEESLDAATVDRLIAATAKKNLVILTGVVDDYVVIFLGSSVDDLKLAKTPEESMVSGDALAFTDAYASKELAAVIYGEKSMISRVATAAGGLADMTEGLREGLAGSEGLGDTRDLEALLRLVGEREGALLKLASNDTYGLCAFLEDGLKVETYGGRDPGSMDWKTPNRLASLGNSPDVAMFANVTVDAAFDEKATEYFETVMETAYAISMKASELPFDAPKMAKFKEYTKMFDTEFRADTVAMWNAFYGDFSKGLGSERAWVFDMNGSMPPIPGVPQPLVDEAKIPRVTMIAPVKDRAKLATAWDAMNAGSTRILAKIGPMIGQEIPMQKPLSSEKNGYTTWFFGMPFLTDDFMPSVTVGDQWFAASSSKNQALDLLARAGQNSDPQTGLIFHVNFNALQKFSGETLKVCKKHSKTLFGPDGMSADDVKKAEKAIAAMDELDAMNIRCRREDGVLRGSFHWKTR